MENHKYYKLIKSIHDKSASIHDPSQNDNLCKAVIEIAFEGGFRGGGAYSKWDCGSWLNNDFEELFLISKNSGRGIEFYEEEIGKNKALEDWINYYDSYLILPIYSYKGKEQTLNGLRTNNSVAKEVWTFLNREWKNKGLMGYKNS